MKEDARWRPGRPMGRDAAETLAVAALAFLAGDEERLARFLSLSGLTPASLRAAAAAPSFLPSVLDYIAGDEALLLRFAADERCDPARIEAARRELA